MAFKKNTAIMPQYFSHDNAMLHYTPQIIKKHGDAWKE
jgi:hypothetical protein